MILEGVESILQGLRAHWARTQHQGDRLSCRSWDSWCHPVYAPTLQGGKLRPSALQPFHIGASPPGYRYTGWKTQDADLVLSRCQGWPCPRQSPGHFGVALRISLVSLSSLSLGSGRGAQRLDASSPWQSCLHPLSSPQLGTSRVEGVHPFSPPAVCSACMCVCTRAPLCGWGCSEEKAPHGSKIVKGM